MSIAILGRFPFHLECISFLLEIFKDEDIDIYIALDGDKYGWLDYYRTLYQNINVFYDSFDIKIIDKYDKIFKLTSNDKCMCHEKIVSILHLKAPEQLNCKSKNFISLTPYITGSNIFNTFPLFKPVVEYSKNKIITFIGYYDNRFIDADADLFIETNNDYLFNFVIYGSCGYPNLEKHKNVRFYIGVNTGEMVKMIKSSKYILSKKYIDRDRFSGQLSLAISFEKPLIIDKKTKEVYGLPGVVFNRNYSELGKIDDINDEQYDKVIEEVRNFKENALNNNAQTVKSIF